MVAAVRDRKLSPAELVHAHFVQIGKEQPRINAVVATYEESARLAAKQATDALAGSGKLLPLHGVRITIKDSFVIAGAPALSDRSVLRGHVGQRYSTAAARGVGAGAIML